MSLQEQFANLKSTMDIAEKELNMLNSGRKSSAPRLRKSLMDLKKNSHSLRSATTEYTRSLPTKTRVKKESKEEPKVETPNDLPANNLKPELQSPKPKKKRQVKKKDVIEN